MKNKFLILLILLFFSNEFFSQTEVINNNSWIIKWNTTAAIDVFSFPTIQFAVEKKIKNHFSVQTEYGIQAYSFNKTDSIFIKTSGHRLMIEGRFYIFSYLKREKSLRKKSDGLYAGVQLFYRKNNYNYSQDYYKSESDYNNHINLISDTFGVKKEVKGMNFCLGYQITFNNFILEPYTYIGALKRDINNLKREYNPDLGHISSDNIHYAGKDLKEESKKEVNFSFGLRVGYKF